MNGPGQTIGIMTANVAHASVFAHLHGACFQQVWSCEVFVKLLDMPSAIGFIATQNDTEATPIGFALISCSGEEAEILSLGVLPGNQRQGIGTHLVGAIHESCAFRNTTRIFLEVNAHDTGAVSFYNKAGYQTVGLRQGYYRHETAPANDALIMRRLIGET